MSDETRVQDRLQDPVTWHMRTRISRIRRTQTVGEALSEIRNNPPTSRIIYFYVVDDEGRLMGVVPTRRLLLSPLEAPVSDIMVKEIITISESATVLDACEFFTIHRLLAFPVVDKQRKLLGAVDVELYTQEMSDIERREGSEEMFQLIGVHLSESQQAKPLVAFRERFPWLLANIGGGILAAFISGFYEHELQRAVALALFIPVVLALAESVSIQSVSLTLQVLRGKQPTLKEILKSLRAEWATGILLGISCAGVIALVASIWLGQWRVVLCLLGGITGGVTFAAMIGLATPNLIRFFHREPQVAAGPVALAVTDMVTLLIYFTLARWLV